MFVNIIGYGYVGSATGYLCTKSGVQFCTCDINKRESNGALANFDNIRDLVTHSEQNNDTNVYFVSVPTPSKPSGECDTSIVESVIQSLYEFHHKRTIVYIKSTVQPGTCRMFPNTPNFTIVFCPEFLREKTHLDDMYNAKFVLLGTSDKMRRDVNETTTNLFKELYKHNKDIQIVYRTYEECEMFKNTINTYLAVKVWYFNKVSEMCEKLGVSYTSLHDLFKLEPRIGDSHTHVPGHDLKRGFGGSCLPKETRSMRYMQQKLGLNDKVLQEILLENELFREKF
ncbi:hypothetical protein EB118_12585 [bacterium]|nr:hypothetical protein [bacterium]NDG30896.1 hypothetical protein [bacterium]